jgi:hypothetical protein
VREFTKFNVFNFNYDQDAQGAKLPIISFFKDDKASVDCEDCFLYLGGGFGIEFESGFPDPKYIKGMFLAQ